MPKMVTIICACGCGREREVRAADVARGWGKFFDKSCKAKAMHAARKKKTAVPATRRKIRARKIPKEILES